MPCAGRARVRIAVRSRAVRGAAPGASAQPLGAWPTRPAPDRPSAGAAITPATGAPSSISAMLTVNSSRPASNSRVPSSGSTSTKRRPSPDRPVAGRFLRNDRHAGHKPRQPFQDDGFGRLVGSRDRRSGRACRAVRDRARGTARIAAAACEAISVRASSSAIDLRISSPQRPPTPTGLQPAMYHTAALTLDARIA